jgi:RNA polymerase sigma factor (sigma-70 family)
MNPRELLAEQWKTVERLTEIVCRRRRLTAADADDFESMVKLKLFEKDCDIVRRFRGDCKFERYLNLIIQRTFVDFCVKRFGKWHPSVAAERLGAIALELEQMLYRDGSPQDEAISRLLTSHPEIDRRDLERILPQIPARERRRASVPIESIAESLCGDSGADVLILSSEHQAMSDLAAGVIRRYLETLAENDRLMLQLSFESDMEISNIARLLGVEQKPLYRRRKRLLRDLRRKMEAAGITRSEDLIGHLSDDSDFGLRKGKISLSRTDEALPIRKESSS